MIPTLEITQVVAETHQLVELILQSEEVKRYRQCRQRLETNPEVQKMIRSFVQKKEAFEEAQRFGKYHPDYQRLNKEMREYKREIDMNQYIAQYKKAERELESMLNELSQLLAHAVSSAIKVPNGNPFWDVGGCGGSGCGSCGSGGCGT